MAVLVMSGQYPCFCEELRSRGFTVEPAEEITVFHKPERRHADMQLLVIGNRVFRLSGCEKPAGKDYPENVRLNCLYHSGRLYGKLSAVEPSVLRLCNQLGIQTVNVNQGYSRCSTLIICENAAVTADSSMEKALRNSGTDVLRISPGHIRLEGYGYGFIGGAAWSHCGITYFFGDITKHPDYAKIRAFCEKYNSKIKILCMSEPLTDIGGVVVLPE